MEWLIVIIAGLMAIVTPTGLILEQVAENTLRRQVKDVEQLAVRIDNVPSYQVAQGKVERIRLASRGVYPIDKLRVDTLELESDRLNVDLPQLQGKGSNRIRQSLREPAQAAVRIVLKEEDLDRALQSPEIKLQLQQLLNQLLPDRSEIPLPSFELLNANFDIQEDNRFRFQAQLQQSPPSEEASQPLELVLEVSVNTIRGRTIQLSKPAGTLNGRKLSSRLLNGFAERLSEQLDLQSLERNGITARVLQLKSENHHLHLAAFIRLEPQAREQ
jgi:LmeA-like phospholipid-binding